MFFIHEKRTASLHLSETAPFILLFSVLHHNLDATEGFQRAIGKPFGASADADPFQDTTAAGYLPGCRMNHFSMDFSQQS